MKICNTCFDCLRPYHPSELQLPSEDYLLDLSWVKKLLDLADHLELRKILVCLTPGGEASLETHPKGEFHLECLRCAVGEMPRHTEFVDGSSGLAFIDDTLLYNRTLYFSADAPMSLLDIFNKIGCSRYFISRVLVD